MRLELFNALIVLIVLSFGKSFETNSPPTTAILFPTDDVDGNESNPALIAGNLGYGSGYGNLGCCRCNHDTSYSTCNQYCRGQGQTSYDQYVGDCDGGCCPIDGKCNPFVENICHLINQAIDDISCYNGCSKCGSSSNENTCNSEYTYCKLIKPECIYDSDSSCYGRVSFASIRLFFSFFHILLFVNCTAGM